MTGVRLGSGGEFTEEKRPKNRSLQKERVRVPRMDYDGGPSKKKMGWKMKGRGKMGSATVHADNDGPSIRWEIEKLNGVCVTGNPV